MPSNTFTIASNNGTEKANPSLSFDGSNYLVAWTDKRNAPINGHHIYAARTTQQGIVLEPDGFPVTETDSTKFDVHAKFDGNQHRLSWWDEDFGQPRVFYKKHITPDGDILDLPTTSNGLPVSTRNIARIGSVLVGGEGLLDVWMTSSNLGANSVANTAERSLIVWERFQALYGAFVYPRSK